MTVTLQNRKILLGVTGSVAAYKALDLTRRLKEAGASVSVIMTDASRKFVTPLSFEIASRNKVFSGMFDDPLSHITLAADADLMVVAPATANIIGKFANGIADDLLSAVKLSFRGPVLLAPAMNWRMYENPVFKKNLIALLDGGALQVGPEKGGLACGEEGVGRMAEAVDIIEAIRSAFSVKDMSGAKVLVTAGPTREYLDPVRFISNRSSGKMGYALARAAMRRGAAVTLVSGSSCLVPPKGVEFISVDTSSEMREAVSARLKDCNVLIMAAAVADFSPEIKRDEKMEKADELNLKFVKTCDILSAAGSMAASLARKPVLVGFAAETGSDISRAKKKLTDKSADIMVFNNIKAAGSGFDVDTNEITIIEKDKVTPLPLMTKDEAAEAVLDSVVKLTLDFS